MLDFFLSVLLGATLVSAAPSSRQASSIHPTALHHITADSSSKSTSSHALSFSPTRLPTPNKDLSTLPSRPVTTSLNYNSMPPFKASGAWVTASCDSTAQSDDATPGYEQWADADADNALQQVVAAFENPDLSQKPGDLPQDFSQFVWNAFHGPADYNSCGMLQNSVCDSLVYCGANMDPPAIHLIMNSMVYIHAQAQEINTALTTASNTISDAMLGLVGAFAPEPQPDISLETFKAILDGVLLLVGVSSAFTWNIALKNVMTDDAGKANKGFLKDSFNTGVSYGFTFGKDAQPSSDSGVTALDIVEQLKQVVANLFVTAELAQTQWLLNLLSFNTSQGAQAAQPFINLAQNGTMITNQQAGANWSTILQAQEQFVYGNVIPVAWQLSPKNFHPFILRIDKSYAVCNTSIPKTSGPISNEEGASNLGDVMSADAEKTFWCDPMGNWWFLISGSDSCMADDSCFRNEGFVALDGVTGTNLDGTQWGGITLEDIILSSYGGFIQNGYKNNYTMDTNTNLVVNDDFTITESDTGLTLGGGIRTPGFFNFTICLDWNEAYNTVNSMEPETLRPICGIKPSTEGVTSLHSSSSYVPGWCGVHVTQFQKNEGNENLSGQYETVITVKDGANLVVGEANKEPNGNPIVVVDSSLPYRLIVATGKVDSDPLEFWYGNEYWDSNSQQCSVGGYDSGHRDLDCGFSCPVPDPNASQPSATSTHPLPGNPTPGIAGPQLFTDTYTLPGATVLPTASPTAGPWKPTFKQGWCTYHLTQYQRNEANVNPSPDYGIMVTFYGAGPNPQQIITLGQTEVPAGGHTSIQGPLQYPFVITVGMGDDDPLSFQYGSATWNMSTPFQGGTRCTTGSQDDGYENGERQMDCGFTC